MQNLNALAQTLDLHPPPEMEFETAPFKILDFAMFLQ